MLLRRHYHQREGAAPPEEAAAPVPTPEPSVAPPPVELVEGVTRAEFEEAQAEFEIRTAQIKELEGKLGEASTELETLRQEKAGWEELRPQIGKFREQRDEYAQRVEALELENAQLKASAGLEASPSVPLATETTPAAATGVQPPAPVSEPAEQAPKAGEGAAGKGGSEKRSSSSIRKS